MFLEAFPDFHITIEDLIAEGDKLVARVSFTGTHRGVYHGIPATNRAIASSGTHIVRYVGKRWPSTGPTATICAHAAAGPPPGAGAIGLDHVRRARCPRRR